MKTQNLLEMVDSLDVKVGWISKNTHGNADLETNQIRLNPESMVVEVFIHEVMHLCHPMLCREGDEAVIDELTSRVYRKLTGKQVRAIGQKLLGR